MFGKKKQKEIDKPLMDSANNYEWHSLRIAELEDQLQGLYRHLGIKFEKSENTLSMGNSVMQEKLGTK